MSENNKSNVFGITGQFHQGALSASAAATASMPKKGDPRMAETLLRALANKAHEQGHSEHQKATELGVTYGYVAQLANGTRAVNTISDDFAAACAEYLGTPRLQVLTMAGRVKPEDYFAGADAYQQDLERALRFIEADVQWCHVLTPELRACSADTQFGVVRLYEVATGTVLMPRRQDEAPKQPGGT
jgi:transcriptional regulator with XRE-family HTH domain